MPAKPAATQEPPAGPSGPAYIAEALWPLAVPLAALQLHPRNPREGDVGAIVESLRAFGQQKPVVAQQRSDGPHTIIAGNHLYRAALALEWTEVAAVVTPMDDRTAMRYLIADNRTQELGTSNVDTLADILSELAMAGQLDATGYDGDDVDDLLKLIENPPDIAALAAKYGDGEDQLPEDFWPRINMRVETGTFSQWQALWNEHTGSDTERLAAVIEEARVGRLARDPA